VVQTWHNTFERGDSLVRVHRVARALLARLSARTIVHTEADVTRLPAWMRGRTVVIPHGDYGQLARVGAAADRDSAREQLGLPADAPTTLLFGQLRPDKGLDDLLLAASAVPGLHVIIGGQELGALATARPRLEDAQLAARVSIHEGFLDMDEAAKLFAATDTVVFPYRQASQSGVLLLAYGFRRPAIVYPVGGLTEAVIDGETGWICARADPDALAAALRESAAAGWQECRRRGDAGAELAESRFAWPLIARRTSDLYAEVLAARDDG
jgi:glycosyltransferase involved in cell wall biosynthesis